MSILVEKGWKFCPRIVVSRALPCVTTLRTFNEVEVGF